MTAAARNRMRGPFGAAWIAGTGLPAAMPQVMAGCGEFATAPGDAVNIVRRIAPAAAPR